MVVGPTVDAERLRSYTTRVFARMQRAGVEIMVFGSGTARTVPDGFPTDRAQTQLKEFVTLCADLAEPRQVRIVLEPQNYTDTNMVHTVPQAQSLANEVDRPNVKVMADFFHMCLNEEPLDDLVAAGPYLAHAHMAEPGRGRPQTTPADHASFFATLERAGYDGRVTKTGPLPAYASEAEAAAALKSLARQGATHG
jgi:sugar phosphate isomerase/epimerase